MSSTERHLLALPDEVLLQALSLLPPDSLAAFSVTCRQAYELLLDDGSWAAWRGSYLSIFDDPAESGWRIERASSQKGGKDWRALTQACYKAANELLARKLGPETEIVTWLALLHLLHTSPASPSPSKNLTLLYPRLLPSLLSFPPGHGARPLLAQLMLHVDHLGAWAADEPAQELGAYREFVYDVATYADAPHFGPYLVGWGMPGPHDDGAVRVRGIDWEKVNGLAQLMGDNLRRSAEQGDWEGDLDDIPLRADYARPGSAQHGAGPVDVVEGDWAGISGVWQGGFAFLDHTEFVAFNFPRLARRTTRINLENYEEVVGNMLTMTLTVDPGSTSAGLTPDGRLSPYTFSGVSSNPLVGSSVVHGSVEPLYPAAHPYALPDFVGPPQETRFRQSISYGGANRWEMEGVVLEGGRGVIGVWTEVNRERRSPLGPLFFYKISGQQPKDDQP